MSWKQHCESWIAEMDQGRQPPVFIALLVFGGLISHVFYLIMERCHPLLRATLRWLRRSAERSKKLSPEKRQSQLAWVDARLAFEARAPWLEVRPLLDQVEKVSERDNLAASFALLYFHNKRFTESRLAARYQLEAPAQWVRENPERALEVREIHRGLPGWYPGGHPKGVQVTAQTDHQTNLRENRRAWYIDGDAVKRYQRARFALLLLDWIENRPASGKQLPPSTEREKHPGSPFGGLDLQLARKLGMKRKRLYGMAEEAERFEFE